MQIKGCRLESQLQNWRFIEQTLITLMKGLLYSISELHHVILPISGVPWWVEFRVSVTNEMLK